MTSHHKFRNGSTGYGPRPLDMVRTAFDHMARGPHPVWIDGATIAGLPDQWLRIDEVRRLMLSGRATPSTGDAVWAHLVERSRAGGDAATLACLGMALPVLIGIAAQLSARFADDPRDVHAGVLDGFLTGLARVDVTQHGLLTRLRWAAFRGGLAAVREALDSPPPTNKKTRGTAVTEPSRHPDWILTCAVAEEVITGREAELIAYTRLEKHTLTALAAELGVSYKALHQVRRRAERRLADYLVEQIRDQAAAGLRVSEVEIRAIEAATITSAAARAQRATGARPPGRPTGHVATRWRDSASGVESNAEKRSSGVRAIHNPPPTTTLAQPSDRSNPTPEVPRCA